MVLQQQVIVTTLCDLCAQTCVAQYVRPMTSFTSSTYQSSDLPEAPGLLK